MAELTHVRVSGPAAAVEAIVRQLRRDLEVAEESRDYPNRREPGVRRYLSLIVDLEQGAGRRAPRAQAEQAKARRDIEAELGILMGAAHALSSQPWFPIRPGDVVAWWVELPGDPAGHGETLVAVANASRQTEAGAPLQRVSETEHGLGQDDAGGPEEPRYEDFQDVWFEAGPEQVTVIRAGRIVHGPAGAGVGGERS